MLVHIGWLINFVHFFDSGAGCMVAAVSASSEKDPIVVGKPSTFMMDFLLKK